MSNFSFGVGQGYNPEQAILGTLKGAEFDRVAAEAARTVPPREHGEN